MYDPDDFGDFIEKINLLNKDQLVDNQGKENRKYTLQTFAEEINNKKIIKFLSKLNKLLPGYLGILISHSRYLSTCSPFRV